MLPIIQSKENQFEQFTDLAAGRNIADIMNQQRFSKEVRLINGFSFFGIASLCPYSKVASCDWSGTRLSHIFVGGYSISE